MVKFGEAMGLSSTSATVFDTPCAWYLQKACPSTIAIQQLMKHLRHRLSIDAADLTPSIHRHSPLTVLENLPTWVSH